VVIALPLTKATHHLFTRERFLQMRRSAILINVTRGEIVRGEDVIMAHHDTVVEPNDHVILFLTDRRHVAAVGRLFQA